MINVLNLKQKIQLAQQLNKDAMHDIIIFFEPTIRKYDRMMNRNEDFRSNMTLHLIELVYAIDVDAFSINSNFAILKYINQALYHEYIRLSKKEALLAKTISFDKLAENEEALSEPNSEDNHIKNILFLESMKRILTEREYICIHLIIIDGYSSTEAARMLGISRQTANENKLRGLEKLKKYIYSDIIMQKTEKIKNRA